MSDLSFLSGLSLTPLEIWNIVIENEVHKQSLSALDSVLSQAQIQKMIISLKFIVNKPENEREEILRELKCPDADKICQLIKASEQYIKNSKPIHQLNDFDWSASIVLGSNQISNLKEPICTFTFNFEDNQNGITSTKSCPVEFTLDEAEAFLVQLEAARSSQRALIPNK